MFQLIVTRLCLLLLFLQSTIQTNIEFLDALTPERAHIFETCRFLKSGDCCVPVDLILPDSRRVNFRPDKVVFEYFSKNAVYVFANAGGEAACGGPSVDAYVDPSAQLFMKDFVARPDQKISGAMFTQSREAVPLGTIRYPWSIIFGSVQYYQSHADPLYYADIHTRRWIRARPQVCKFLPSLHPGLG
ncbi:MAG: hypothetical protein Q9206_000524 [Seirophora lacunosa]